MTNRKFLTGLAIFMIYLFIVSCKKNNGDPTIKFIPGPGFSGRDTAMMVKDTIKLIIEVNWNGVDVLENLEAKRNDVTIQVFDLGDEKTILNLSIIKGNDQTEEWVFVAKDVERNQAEIGLTLSRDTPTFPVRPLAAGDMELVGFAGIIRN